MGKPWLLLLATMSCVADATAQRTDALGPRVRAFVRIGTARVILEHVQVIDGSGAAPLADRNVTIDSGVITAIHPGADLPPAAGTTILDLRGHSVMPGIVGMHDHLFAMARPEGGPALFVAMIFSAPRLYLANGVTTLRTAGSIAPYADVNLRRAIDSGLLPGPHIDVTVPYLDGPGNPNPLIHELSGPDDARQTVEYWAERGVTSFKAYAHITRAELGAAIAAAHQRGLKVTGHLCSVTYPEAIALGIDNLEHGFSENTELAPGKQPDTCSAAGGDSTLLRMSPGSPEARRLIALLVGHHVAVTSTMALRASAVPGLDSLRPAVLAAMNPGLRDAYLASRAQAGASPNTSGLRLRREMELERAFVAAGGLLLAGSDPVGLGGVLPGFGDQREIELLVEAGFTPVEAIRIATLNGAIYLERQDRIGSLVVGKNADLVVVRGDPATRIADIENVVIVFKDGVGYDPEQLLASVRGRYGEY